MEVVPHLVDREAIVFLPGRGVGGGSRPGGEGDVVGKPAMGAVEIDEGPGHRRRAGGGVHHLLGRRQVAGEHRIGQDLAHLGGQPLLELAAEVPQIEIVGLRQLQQQPGGERPLIPLDEVQIAGGNVQIPGHGGLGHPQRLPQAPHPRPGEYLSLAHRCLQEFTKFTKPGCVQSTC